MKKWQKEYDNHVKSLEKGGGKGFEDFEGSTIGEVDAQKEMERAKREIQEREEKKAITMGGDDTSAAPRMTMTVRLCFLYKCLVLRNSSGKQDERDCTVETSTLYVTQRGLRESGCT